MGPLPGRKTRCLKRQSVSRARGDEAERWALAHLQAKGLTVVDRNYRCRFGELDLVCLDGPVLAFVEVRRRQRHAVVGALESLTEAKLARVRAAAKHFLSTHRHHARRVCRFDVVAITGDHADHELEWIKDAFE